MNRLVSFLMFLLIFSGYFPGNAQKMIVDQVVAIVGDNIIIQSDIENQFLQMKAQGYTSRGGDMKCEILEDLLIQKLMLNQAKVDSIIITDAQVEQTLNNQLQNFMDRIGSQEKLEAYYNKSLLEIKDDFRDLVRNQLLTQEMQASIAQDITVTPSEIKAFYKSIPKDSLPLIPSQVEYRQLVRNPPFNKESKIIVRQKLLDLRKRIMEGEDFATLAILYSEDPGSAPKGGELGFQGKTELVKEFADMAFSLKKGAVSPIVETKFGFHIMQLIDRQGEKVNVRHILMKPKVTMDEIKQVFDFLDSLVVKINQDSVPFSLAVQLYSEDEDSRMSGGVMVNPNTRDTKFQLDQLDQATARAIQNLDPGENSKPFETQDMTGNRIFKIIKLSKRIEPHKASLKLDYTILQEMTKNSKQQEVFLEWIEDKQITTYIRIDKSYRACQFSSKTWVK